MTDTADPRDGSMAGINGPMPPAQAQIYATVPAEWAWVPRIGVPALVLRALVDRGIVETQWHNGNVAQWRRTPPA